jgi:penicillin amidase
MTAKALLHLLEAKVGSLATYDASSKDSAIWDFIDTSEKESRNERIIEALLDADDWLQVRLGPRPDDWRWGTMHKVALQSTIPGASTLTLPAWNDPIFLQGYPRPGDLFSVNFAPYNTTPSSFDALSFAVTVGSSMRLLVEMGHDGPSAQGVLAGPQSLGISSSGSTSSEVEYWRKDLSHALATTQADVIASAKQRTVGTAE